MRRPARFPLLALVACIAAGACGSGIEGTEAGEAAALTGGDPAQGVEQIRRYGCGTCHTIAGVREADGLVGPPLTGVGARVYLAGVLVNTPDNLVRWIMDPQAIDSLTAMPDLGVGEREARHIAAYLYTLD